MNTFFIEHLIIVITFLGITAHTGDTIKYDGVFFFYCGDKLVPVWSTLSGASVELADNGGFRVEFCDVRNLTSDTLMFCG